VTVGTQFIPCATSKALNAHYANPGPWRGANFITTAHPTPSSGDAGDLGSEIQGAMGMITYPFNHLPSGASVQSGRPWPPIMGELVPKSSTLGR